MPFVQRCVEPKLLSRTNLFDEDGTPKVVDEELQAVTNSTLCNALRQLASLVLAADDIFQELGGLLQVIYKRSETLKVKINVLEGKVTEFDPKEITVPESDIAAFAVLKNHYHASHPFETNMFSLETRPAALRVLYECAAKTPIHTMRQLDRCRKDGRRSSGFFLCTPVLGAKRKRIRTGVDIEIETSVPVAVEELRRWTSDEALGDVTVAPDCSNRISTNVTVTDDNTIDETITSDDEAIDHKLPSPEEQLQVVALKFPAEIVAVDISGKSFDRMSIQRRTFMHGEVVNKTVDVDPNNRRKGRSKKPRSRRRNTLAGTDHKEIHEALTAGEEPSSPTINHGSTSISVGAVSRSKSSDPLRSMSKKGSPENKKSHFSTLKAWGKSRYDKFMNKSSEGKSGNDKSKDDIDDFNIYETVTMKRKRDLEKERRTHERNSSISSSEKSSINIPVSNTLSSVLNIAVKLRDSSSQRRQRRTGGNKDEPHSSSGNWSASSESGRASIGSEITSTTHPKSTTSAATSSNSLNQPSSVNSRRRLHINTSASESVTSEGTLTPDIIHDLHEDGETSSVYSCDTEGYYTSFHMDSGLKTLKEEDILPTPLHFTSAFSNSSSNTTALSAENEYELFGKGSTSTTTSSAGTVCTTLRASESNKSLVVGPAVPERKSSLSKLSNKSSAENSLERDFSDKTGTVKRSPASNSKPTIVALIHKQNNGDISPDSGHNTSSSPIESISSPNGVRSGSDFEFSESSDMEGPERIERIRVKTTINSSRIPSMCVITPPHSDDESENSSNSSKNNYRKQLEERNAFNQKPKAVEEHMPVANESRNDQILPRIISTIMNNSNKLSLISVNNQTGYATIQTIDQPDSVSKSDIKNDIRDNNLFRAPSPSGGTVVVKEESTTSKTSPSTQPIIKASLLPLNNMFGRLKNNLANLTHKRDRSKSPNTKKEHPDVLDEGIFDAGEYVTIADVRNNNEKVAMTSEDVTYVNDSVNRNLSTVLSGKIRDTEYVSLNDLPSTNNNITSTNADSLERKRQGARVMLDAEGKVVYSSDSLKRRKGAHSTFDPGPRVKPPNSPRPSPLPVHRVPKIVRPVQNTQNHSLSSTESRCPLSPQTGKLIIKASSGIPSPTAEIVRMPPSTIVAPSSRSLSPKPATTRGAYVRIQEAENIRATQEKEIVPPSATNIPHGEVEPDLKEMYRYVNFALDPTADTDSYMSMSSQYYIQKGNSIYSTLPLKRTPFFENEVTPERSVTPDITRGLEQNYNPHHSLPRNFNKPELNQNLDRDVQMPHINRLNLNKVPLENTPKNFIPQNYKPAFSHSSEENSLKISPIDPRHSTGFHSSTPSKITDLKASINLETKLLSPKKSTMSNEELYAAIHKSKKKMNIETQDTPRSSPVTVQESIQKQTMKSPETGYFGENKLRSRLSWSPSKGEYVDFNSDIDKFSPANDSRSRQSWACSDRKPKSKQTSTIDFKRLLLQKSTSSTPKKISAVEQLQLSKQQIKPPQPKPSQPEMNILDLSSSPRSLVNRRFQYNSPGSPSREPKPVAKILSPRSQWRFANPRSDVLSSTILEDCREDESPTNSGDRRRNILKSGNVSPRSGNNSPKSSIENVKADAKPETSPKGMPRYTLENKPYTSATQRLYAQRAQFFSSVVAKSPNKNAENTEFSSPTLETAF